MPDFKKRPPADEGSNSPAVQPQDELRRSYRDAKAKSGATPQPRPPFSKSKWSELLTAYFYSGWAFLIPYLVTYLLYAWLKWPVNPQIHNEDTKLDVGASVVPCLLHLYWVLHAAHVFLGIVALKIWWQKGEKHHGDHTSGYTDGSPTLNRLWPILPWLMLALIFWIPGPYLEFPADPWAHVGRITMWEHYTFVCEHPTWTKSSYFMYASLLPPASTGYLPRVAAITFILTGTSLLLCWQQYRLAQVLGLGKRPAFVFVLLQTLMMGNSSFSFYRYYSLSTTIVGQLAATALVVVVVRRLFGNFFSSAEFRPPSAPRFFIAIAGLGLLCGFSHPQSVAIAAVMVTAVVASKLMLHNSRFLLAIIAVAIVGSILAVRYYPRHAMLDQYYVPTGWLTQTYSFNLYSFSSPAVNRSVQILGVAGLLNLILAVALVRRNLLASLLCIAPVAALLIPLFSLPFASALATGLETPVQMFHRLYFAMPAGITFVLASVWVSARWRSSVFASTTTWNLVVLTSALAAFVTIPSGYPWFNRTYHLLVHPAADTSYVAMRRLATEIDPNCLLIATPGGEYVASVWNGIHGLRPSRVLRDQTSASLDLLRSRLESSPIKNSIVIPVSPLSLYTPASTLGLISGHWLPVATALDCIVGVNPPNAMSHIGTK